MKLGLNLTIIIMTAIICITGLNLYALSKGIDGILLTATIGAIVGIPTWFITKKVSQAKGDKK